MNNLKAVGVIVFIAALFTAGIYYNVVVWNECRETNSWLYCMRVLSK